MEEKLLTTDEAAALLAIKPSKLRSAVFKREIPYLKIGRLVRFAKADLMKWLEARKKPATNN